MNIQTLKYSLLSILFFSFTALAVDDAWTRSYSLEANGQYIEAAKTIEKFLKQVPGNEFAELRSGWLYYLASNHSRSIKHYQTALRLNGQSIEARLGITLPLMAQGRWQEAAIQSNEVIKISQWNYYAHVRLMTCEEALKQWPKLIKHAEKVHNRYPADPTILVYLARANKQIGNTSKTRQAYNEVLIRVPGHIEASRYLVK